VAEPPGEIAPLLNESSDAVVILGGRWPDLRAPLRETVNARAPALVVLQEDIALESVREVLELGASAILRPEIPISSLNAAVMASRAGLIVLDRPLAKLRESVNPDHIAQKSHHRTGRPLTTRERKILALVAGGISNKGIARILGVSANTVKFHLVAAFEKLNAATRAEAVAEAMRRGELSL
jgi:DNA-binding NarL/FixJ family response regulator